MDRDTILLLHPFIAVTVVFPLLGMVMNRALQTRQRRIQLSTGSKKSTIPASTGPEHAQLGRWLTGSVVGIVLLAFANDVFGNIIDKQVWAKSPFQVILISLVFVVAIASLSLLYRAKTRLWRIVFAILTSVALIVIGSQDGVYRKTEQWYISHYYYGITAALLMIFSLAIVREIYQDRTHRWRNIHIILNSIALLLFIGQAFTGTQALLEVPLAWQKPYVKKLYEQQCDKKPCTVQSAPALKMPK
jgi:membrane protein YdbS with pleckstrin-like domain